MPFHVIEKFNKTWINIPRFFRVLYTSSEHVCDSLRSKTCMKAIINNIEGLDLPDLDKDCDQDIAYRPTPANLISESTIDVSLPSVHNLKTSIQAMIYFVS